MPTVHFIHGLEGSAQGNKARLLARHFDTLTPAMDTADFAGCVALHAGALDTRRADVVVGSSFGGAVLAALIQRRLWSGPALFLAQAALRHGLAPELPTTAPVWIVHGTRDAVIDIDDSRRLARANVHLIEVDDDHSLHASTDDGALLEWVAGLAVQPAAGGGSCRR